MNRIHVSVGTAQEKAVFSGGKKKKVLTGREKCPPPSTNRYKGTSETTASDAGKKKCSFLALWKKGRKRAALGREKGKGGKKAGPSRQSGKLSDAGQTEKAQKEGKETRVMSTEKPKKKKKEILFRVENKQREAEQRTERSLASNFVERRERGRTHEKLEKEEKREE